MAALPPGPLAGKVNKKLINGSDSGRTGQDPLIPLFDFFKVILKTIHPLFAVDCGVLVVYNQNITSVIRAYVSTFDHDKDEVTSLLIADAIPLTAIQKEVANFPIPILKTSREWQLEMQTNHKLINGEAHYAHHCYIPLEVNNQLLGTLELHNATRELGTECLAFCSNIADMLSELLRLDANGAFTHNYEAGDIEEMVTQLAHKNGAIAGDPSQPQSMPIDEIISTDGLHGFIAGLTDISTTNELAALVGAQVLPKIAVANIFIALKDDNADLIYPYLSAYSEKNTDSLPTDQFSIDDEFFVRLDTSQGVETFATDNFAKDGLIHALKIKTPSMSACAIRYQKKITGYLLVPSSAGFSQHQNTLLKQVADLLGPVISSLIDRDQLALQQQMLNQYRSQSNGQKGDADGDTIKADFSNIIGEGPAMQRVFALMGQVAQSDSTVLILGDTGTGKELIAQGIHDASNRTGQPMIRINCAAIPANLIESELFGHERGAFTGATDRRLGKFELADKGTLFLDEIGEVPLDLQVKLLRALQEKEIERVGGKATIKVDVRIIAATNRNLLTEVEAGRFRRDLFYRLNVFPIALPALRDRSEDIAALAAHFLFMYARKSGRAISGFSQRALQQLRNYDWPGNVRELEHLIERQVLLTQKDQITSFSLPTREKTLKNKEGVAQKVKTIDENERDHIFSVLQLCRGRISGPDGAAKLLGVPATTLNSKIKRLGLAKKHF